MGQSIGAPRVARVAQLHKYFHLLAFLGHFSFRDIDRPGVEIPSFYFAPGIDGSNLEDISTVRPQPSTLENIKRCLALRLCRRFLLAWASHSDAGCKAKAMPNAIRITMNSGRLMFPLLH